VSGGQRATQTVVLDSARTPDSELRVVTDDRVWRAVCGLSARHGHAADYEESIPLLDAKLMAEALRRGAATAGGVLGGPLARATLWRVIALLEDGGGALITRRVKT
jgi:hypothetical protein